MKNPPSTSSARPSQVLADRPSSTARPSAPTTRGVRAGGRSARVVEAVLEGAIEELAAQGYAGLTFEAVAQRASVAKTTIYRRWPTKVDLVRAAILKAINDENVEVPDTGGLHGDLYAYLQIAVRKLNSPRGSSIWRMLWAEADDPDVMAIKLALRDLRRATPEAIVSRAVARGELPLNFNPDLLFQLPIAALCHRRFFSGGANDEAYLRSLVAVVVLGLTAYHAQNRR